MRVLVDHLDFLFQRTFGYVGSAIEHVLGCLQRVSRGADALRYLFGCYRILGILVDS